METKLPVRARVVAAWPGYVELDLGDGIAARARRTDLVPPPGRLGDLDALVGGEIEGLVVAVEPDERGVIVSPRHLAILRFGEALRRGRRVSGRVVAANDGGIIVEVGGARGFVPRPEMSTSDASNHRALVGCEWRGYVVQATARKFILSSRRPRARRRRERRRARLLRWLRPGVELRGRVVSVKDFGAFVRLGRAGIDGLVSRDELSWWKVWSAREVVREGQRLKVRVLAVRHRDGSRPPQIDLSHRATLPNPWPQLARELRPGTMVECAVRSIAPFGIVVRLLPRPHVETVVPTDVLHTGRRNDRGEGVAVGQRLWARVENVDVHRGRLYLGECWPTRSRPHWGSWS